jgi:rubrerythrin
VRIGIDEWEALRLKDYLGLEQQQCAAYMNLAQSTFQRILASARIKLTRAVVEGKTFRIEGGNYQVISLWSCRTCGREWEDILDREGKIRQLCPSCGTEKVFQRRRGCGWNHPHQPGPGRKRRRGK